MIFSFIPRLDWVGDDTEVKKMEWMKGKKTYIIGASVALHGLLLFLTGEQTLMEFIQGSKELYEVISGGGIMALRAAVKKVEDKQ